MAQVTVEAEKSPTGQLRVRDAAAELRPRAEASEPRKLMA